MPPAQSRHAAAAPILVVSGSSGVGKSTVSELLVASLPGSVHVPMDALCRFFVDPFPDPASPEGTHRYEVVGAAGAAMAAAFARGGYTVILDGYFLSEGADSVAEICGGRGVAVNYAVLRAELDVCLERSRRRDPGGPPDLDLFTSLHARFANLAHHERHVIDATGPPEQVADMTLSAFRSGRLALTRP